MKLIRKELKKYLLLVLLLQCYCRSMEQNSTETSRTNKSSQYDRKKIIGVISVVVILSFLIYYFKSKFKDENLNNDQKNTENLINSLQSTLEIEKFLSDLVSIKTPHTLVEIIINDPVLALKYVERPQKKLIKSR